MDILIRLKIGNNRVNSKREKMILLKKNAIPTKANRNLRFINGVIVLEAFPRTGNRKAEKVFYDMPECIRLKIGENTENGKKEKVIQATFDGVRFAEIMGYEIVVKE